MSAELHVIFGAGQVGQPLARILIEAGKQVRIARRSPSVLQGAEIMQGDAADPEFCARAASGAATVYHCMNPPYQTRVWAELVPRYMNNLIAAAGRAGARLVVLDNVYGLGRANGRSLDEETPLRPCSRKGEIRARAAGRLFEAHARGEVVATTGRASDFYGPGGTLTGLGDFFWPRVLAGKTAYSPYSLDAVHTYHYIPDVAAGLAALGCAEADVYGRPWMLPCAPAEPLRALVTRLAHHLGRAIPVAQIPGWLLKLTGIAIPFVREIGEMLYQWDEPFVVDDRRFRARFHQEPTALDDASRATVDWARQHYAKPIGG
jgi:nucleoside-diphosphate-sugar epimerase